MAEPIRKKKPDLTAPTPQNTPAQNAPISSRAQAPKVMSIKEEDLERATAAQIFAQNPRLVSMIQGKLGSLIGKSSGYIESLPPIVRKRVSGLKGIQKEHAKLETQFQEEVLELEKKYFKKFTPLYEQRAKIVNGSAEPTEEEVKAGESEEGQEADAPAVEAAAEPADVNEDAKGIPEFWLSAMKNHASLGELITDRDEEALKHLTDVRLEYLDQPGFRLIFEFAQNDYFTNKTITKTYFYQEDTGYGGDYIYDHAEGDKIEWEPDKDLTVRVESKKQRNKTTKQVRVVKKTVPTDSFFNFFNPPQAPDEEDEDVASDIEDRLELDYQLGEDVKEKIIPRAIDWFTGEAIQYEELDEDLDEDDLDDEDDDDDEEQSDERDDDEESEEEEDGSKPKQETADCKQS